VRAMKTSSVEGAVQLSLQPTALRAGKTARFCGATALRAGKTARFCGVRGGGEGMALSA